MPGPLLSSDQGFTEGGLPNLNARPDSLPAAGAVRVVHIVRHGEAGDGAWPLPATAALSSVGQKQVRRAASTLATRLDADVRIFSSDLLRCRQTAEVIAAALQGEMVLDHRLRELDFGWDGLDGHEVLRRVGEERLARFLRDPARGDLPGAERFSAFWARIRTAAADALQLANSGQIVLVAHDGVNRVLALLARGLGPDAWTDVAPWRHGEVRALPWLASV